MNPVRFLKAVWGPQSEGNPYFCLSTKHARNGKWKDHYLRAPINTNQLRAFFEQYPPRDYHLYFCPTPLTAPRRRKENVEQSGVLWADLDEANPQRLDPKPQVVWESSPGRFAALWILNQMYPAHEVEPKCKALAYAHLADKGGWDLTQVLRIPGTPNHKYKGSPDGKLLWFTDNLYPLKRFSEVSAEPLDPEQILDKYKKKIPRAVLNTLCAKTPTVGKRSEVLWRLEHELSAAGLSVGEIMALIKASVWNKFAGRADEDKQLAREINKITQSRPEPRKSIAGMKVNGEVNGHAHRDDEALILRLADVEPEDVQFLWYPYIAEGKVTLVEGDPGLGKSWLTTAIAAYLSQKRKLPGQDKARRGPILLFSAEDGIGDTIRPRLDRLGADVRKIFAFNSHVVLDEEGLELVDEQIEEVKPSLVVFDPIVAYMGGKIDLHKANETRAIMSGLSRIAERHQVAVVAVRHLTKGGRDKAMYRGIGSIDLTAAARSVLMVLQDPEDEDARLVCHIKSNLAPRGKAIRYYLHPTTKGRPFEWGELVDVDTEALLGAKGPAGKSELKDALEYLKDMLARKDRKERDILNEAETKGISEKALKKAREEAAVRTYRKGSSVYWSLQH